MRLFRRYGLLTLTVLLLVLTVAQYWPRVFSGNRLHRKKAKEMAGVEGFSEPPAGVRRSLESALEKMAPPQRQKFEERLQADRTFFASVRELPEIVRRERVQEYLSSHPLPLELMPPNGGPPNSLPPLPGPPGISGRPDAEPMHLPDPATRYALDQQVANSQSR